MMSANIKKVEASVQNDRVDPPVHFYQSDEKRTVFGWDGARNFIVLSSEQVGATINESNSMFFRIDGVIPDGEQRTHSLTKVGACSYWAWEPPVQCQYLPDSGELTLSLDANNKLQAIFKFHAVNDGGVVVITEGVVEGSGIDSVSTVEEWCKSLGLS